MDVTLRLERGLADVAWARHELLAYLREAGHEPDPCSLALVVSELVTNALVHGGGEIDVRVRLTAEGHLRVEVRDGGSGAPRTQPDSTSAESGRGLVLVAALVERWGVDHFTQGKAVWAELSTTSWSLERSTTGQAPDSSATHRSSTSHGGRITPPIS